MHQPHHQHHRPRMPLGLLVAGGLLAAIPLIGCMAFAYLQWAALASAYPFVVDTIRNAFAIGVTLLILYYGWLGAMGIYHRWASRAAAYADKEIAHTRAKVQIAPLATSFTYHDAHQVTAAEQLALPASIDVIKPMAEWLAWVDVQPHCLLAGRTKAGKTHTATALLAQRLRASETVYIIDPHSSGWMGLPTVGFVGLRPDGKPDTAALNAALIAVASEYIRRMKVRDDHKSATGNELPHDHWPRLTVLIDEANYIADVLPTIWREFVKALASGGRKVGISLLMMAQSPLVEDIQISGSMRANFARLGLDDRSIQQLIGSDEKDPERKKALNAALINREHPAAAAIDAQVWLLDRHGLEFGTAPVGARRLVWSEQPSSVSPTEPLPTGNEGSSAVTSPEAESSTGSNVPTAVEIATIAARLGTGTPSEVAKTLDGYHPRKYAEYKAKVDYVQALLKGGTC